MKRLLMTAVVAGLAGCGDGAKELPVTKDPDAIKREQERLQGGPATKPKGAK